MKNNFGAHEILYTFTNLINKGDAPPFPRTKIVPKNYVMDIHTPFTDLARKKDPPENCSKYCLPKRAKAKGTKRTKKK